MHWEGDVALSAHTRFRIGGPAPRFGRVESEAELRSALRSLDGCGYRVLGWGANVLVADRGLDEAVLILGGDFDYLRLEEDRIEAGAAAGLPAFVGEARRAARSGWSFLEAVPGTVGGALRMNAGSAETGIWDRVDWIDALTPDGRTERLTAADAGASYRRVEVPENRIFLRGLFAATPGSGADVDREHLTRRRTKVESQVYDLPSCGSIWKNPDPPAEPAWKLVDRVGMRGARRGDAQIAEKHANFIVNLGRAAADDVLWLMRETHRRVREQVGLHLEAEIRLWGFEAEQTASIGGSP